MPAPPPRPAPVPPVAPPPVAPPSAPRVSATRWWVIAAAGAAVVAAGVAVVLSLTGTRSPATVLDIGQAQQQVEQMLRDPVDGYGAGTVTGVVCNDGVNPAITAGRGFYL